MKIKHIFLMALATSCLFAGCTKDEIGTQFNNLTVDNNYLTIGMEGGRLELNVTATEAWQFVIDENWPLEFSFNKDAAGKTIKAKHDKHGNCINDEADIKSKTPSWLDEPSVMSGQAGTTKVVFDIPSTEYGREIEISLYAGDSRQFVRIRQGSMVPELATAEQVIAGPDGKTYTVTGVCQSITNTLYGNWIIADATGSFTIYGTLDKDGKPQNFTSLGIEVGDIITVQGPKTTYGGSTVELVDVTVLNIEKSLLKQIDEASTMVVNENGEDVKIRFAYKGSGVYATVDEDCQGWVSYMDTEFIPGKVTIFEKNPADTAIVTLRVAPLEDAAVTEREGVVKFKSSLLGEEDEVVQTTVELTIQQFASARPGTLETPFTVAEAIEYVTALGGETTTDFYVKGIVSKFADKGEFDATKYGNGTFFISDDGVYHNDKTLDFEAYRVSWLGNQKWVAGNKQPAVGDEVILCGHLTVYSDGTPETASGAYVYSVNGLTDENHGWGTLEDPFTTLGAVTVANALGSGVTSQKPYYIAGKVSKVVELSTDHGNATFYISEDGVYHNDKSMDFEAYRVRYLGNRALQEGDTIKEGDDVIVCGQLTLYNETAETASGKAYVYSLNGKTE